MNVLESVLKGQERKGKTRPCCKGRRGAPWRGFYIRHKIPYAPRPSARDPRAYHPTSRTRPPTSLECTVQCPVSVASFRLLHIYPPHYVSSAETAERAERAERIRTTCEGLSFRRRGSKDSVHMAGVVASENKLTVVLRALRSVLCRELGIT